MNTLQLWCQCVHDEWVICCGSNVIVHVACCKLIQKIHVQFITMLLGEVDGALMYAMTWLDSLMLVALPLSIVFSCLSLSSYPCHLPYISHSSLLSMSF
jgi:hypothetical protein